jgi:endonuclease YncB( thermonuclease family)
LIAILMLVAMPVAAQTATDGDTIKLAGVRWRLWGIDAPELHQICADGWLAGLEAKRQLERLMAGAVLVCEDRGRDRYGRSIGLCRAGGRDLGADIVRAGMAWAFNHRQTR